MKIRHLILLTLSILLLAGSVFALPSQEYIWDEANILSKEEEAQLTQQLAQISKDLNVAIVVATVNDEAHSVERLGDNFFRTKTGRQNGIILFLAFGEIDNDYYIGAQGTLADKFNDRMFDKVENACVPHLRSRDYVAAISAYATACEDVISSYGKVSTAGIALCILIGSALSFLIPMNILKGQLKTVRYQPEANDYIRKNSLTFTRKTDTFLHQSVSRVAKPKNSGGSGSRSSGGSSGRSGKF